MVQVRVAALVVTYNRKELLAECLQAILDQTFPVSEIILIDNASTDGTPEFLKEKGFLEKPFVKYVRMDTNTGGSGGFYEGLKRFREGDCDWVWLMDDDTIPTAECLEELVKAKELLCQHEEKVSFLASSVYGPENEFMNVPEISKKASPNGYPYWYKYLNEGIVNIHAATFVSLLINIDAVRKCGLPCRDYFIWGDDKEYTKRLTTYYADAYMVGSSVAVHKRVNAKFLDIHVEFDDNRIEMFHYLFRNVLVTKFCYDGTGAGLSLAFRQLGSAVKMLKNKKGLKKSKVMIKGTFEALSQQKKFRRYIEGELNL